MTSFPFIPRRIAAGRHACRLLIIIALLSISHGITLHAQQRADVVAIGMGKASVATARGLSALYSNVGAMGLDLLGVYDSSQQVELDVALLPLGAVAGSTYLTPGDLNFVFDKKDSGIFTDEDRLRLAPLVEEGRLSADAEVDAFAIRLRAPRVGAIGLRYGHRVRAHMIFPENFRTGVLGSGDVFSKGQRFENPEIGGEWTRHLTVSLASAFEREEVDPNVSAWFPAFGMGMSLSYVQGVVHFDVDQKSWAETHVIPSPPGEAYRSIKVNGYYTFRSSTPLDTSFNPSDAILSSQIFGSKNVTSTGWEGGFGLSIVVFRKAATREVSITGNPLEAQQYERSDGEKRDAVTFGLTVDGVGAMTWNGTNRRRQFADIEDTLNDRKGGISNDVIYRYEAKLDTIGVFRTEFPMTMRLGLGADITSFVPGIPGDLLASFETAVDLNHQIGGERNTRASLGAEWRPSSFLTLRSGLQLGGRVGAALALGVGIKPFPWLAIEAATSEVTSLFFADRRRIDAALMLSTHVAL